MPDIRDRVKELRRVPASSLRPSPRNWRTHPKAQTDALRGVLAEIGFADALLVRETPEGLELVDGHLRAAEMGDALVPVLVLDLDEEEAGKLLLTLDPLAGMAEANKDSLTALLESVRFQDGAVNQMLATLAQNAGIKPPEFQPVGIEEQGRLDEKAKVTCPECGHEFTP